MRKGIMIVAFLLIGVGGGIYFFWPRLHSDPIPETSSSRNTQAQPAQPDTTAPRVVTSYSSLESCRFLFTPTISDDQKIERVEYSINDALSYVTYAAPFTFDWAAGDATSGTNIVTITAYDMAKNKASSTTSLEVSGTCSLSKETPTTVNRNITVTGASVRTTSDAPAPSPDITAPTAPVNLSVAFNDQAHLNELTWQASQDAGGVKEYAIFRDGSQIATSAVPRYFDLKVSDGRQYNDYQVFAIDAAQNVSSGSNQVDIRLAPQTVWTSDPGGTDPDTTGTEVGMKFTPNLFDGQAVGVRFYKAVGNTGTHVGNLWQWDSSNNTGTNLASVAFTGESESGWQTAYFDTPVTLVPGTTYVVSYYAPNGNVSSTLGFFSDSHNSPYLMARLTAGDYYAGTYKVGQGFPDQNGCCSVGYGVDIAFALPEKPSQEPITPQWTEYYQQWSNGPQIAPGQYPVALWQQWAGREYGGVLNGVTYQNMGIHFDVGLFGWPAAAPEQIQGIVDTNWKAFAAASADRAAMDMEGVAYATTNPNGQYLKGYLIDDEPDMNKVNYAPGSFASAPNTESYADAVRAADPTRPTIINFGKPMAIDQWSGYTMIDGASALADFRQYCRAGDIVSADYYGWTDPYESAGYHGAWTYGEAIDNMRKHCGDNKPIWGFLETSKLWTSGDCDSRIPTPDQLEQAIWNMVIHGANGIEYFGQQFCGGLMEDAFLADAPMKARMQSMNEKLQSYGTILNTTSLRYFAAGVSDNSNIPIDTLAKQHDGSLYLFAQAGGSNSAPNSADVTGTIYLNSSASQAEVLGENRSVPIADGRISDQFTAYGVHIYKIIP